MSSLIAYLPTSSDVIPTPNYDNFVYFQYFDDIAGDDVVVNFNNVFPDGSQITPPYNYAVLLSWSGLTLDDDDNYIPINYNVGETFVKNKSVFLYPIWSPMVICFKEGTKILSLDTQDNTEKYLPIETLSRGSLVKTLSSGYKPISLIGHSKIYNPANTLRSKNRLYKCHKEKYPELIDDLVITGCHSILIDNMNPKQLADTFEFMGDIYVTENKYRLMACLDERADTYEEEGVFSIWHFSLENENVRTNYGVYANGLLVESTSHRMMTEFSGMELV